MRASNEDCNQNGAVFRLSAKGESYEYDEWDKKSGYFECISALIITRVALSEGLPAELTLYTNPEGKWSGRRMNRQ